jgi:hypothetical protein
MTISCTEAANKMRSVRKSKLQATLATATPSCSLIILNAGHDVIVVAAIIAVQVSTKETSDGMNNHVDTRPAVLASKYLEPMERNSSPKSGRQVKSSLSS